MQELKRMGVKLSVDDFGMGHASLEYLRRILADEVKIDRSFVSGIDTSEDDRALVESVIQMIHSLGRTAVAEGVENARVLELLREMGCEEAQGYYFSHPVAMDDLLAQMPKAAAAAKGLAIGLISVDHTCQHIPWRQEIPMSIWTWLGDLVSPR
ncbi:hypothetical protein A9995_03830 [Erythrobacter sp. QSSC1-22B]|nr:EAL domain-containing protein [Erythrobacter sp. QSSC1-22B]OBX20818.1 hypothetical protein A9995_03830 [Erythrobacter sp. QSSC1-22B]